jgi:hypothetical protein
MPVRKTIPEKDGVYFLTFTCARWLPLFAIADGYNYAYKWFDVLVKDGSLYNWIRDYAKSSSCDNSF